MRPKVISKATQAVAKVALTKGIRINGRGPSDFRDVKLNFGNTPGFCEVIYEPGTRVYVQISASIGEPMDSRPGEGAMSVAVWISPAATGEMVGTGSQKHSLLSRMIDRLFKENRAVDLESLCIKFGEKAWILRADIHFIDINGSLSEAACLAVLGGLLTFRRPRAYIDNDTGELVVSTLEESSPIKIHMFHLPLITTFTTYEGILIAEPDYEEEEIFKRVVVVGVNDSREVCFQSVTRPISLPALLEANRLATAKCVERIRWVKQMAEEEDKARDVPECLKEIGPRSTGIVMSSSDVEKLYEEIVERETKLAKQSKKSGEDLTVPAKKIVILDRI